MNASIFGVECPSCGEGVEVRAEITPGEPMVTSGPPDNWYPGSGPELEDWAVFADCKCDVDEEEFEAQVEENFDRANFIIDELEGPDV